MELKEGRPRKLFRIKWKNLIKIHGVEQNIGWLRNIGKKDGATV